MSARFSDLAANIQMGIREAGDVAGPVAISNLWQPRRGVQQHIDDAMTQLGD